MQNKSIQMIDDIKNYTDLLEAIRNRPQMWLSGKERSITLLSTLISGIQLSEMLHKVPTEKEWGNFDWKIFELWISENYNPKGVSLNSFSLASHLSSSEPVAFDLWFSWYDRFLSEKFKILKQ